MKKLVCSTKGCGREATQVLRIDGVPEPFCDFCAEDILEEYRGCF